MQVTVYNCRPFDEKELFTEYAEELGLDVVLCGDAPNPDNVSLCRGSRCVNVITSRIDAGLMRAFRDNGVEYITTRTIGYDHIDLEAARACGIRVGNAPYGPNGVADYTVMLILMTIRKMGAILERTALQDYTLAGLNGRELRDLTVGVIGTGRIGETVVRDLSGFGCRILAHDLCEKETVRQYAAYVPLDEIWREADVITLHMPLTEDNRHMINAETIGRMKDGVAIVNTARGALIDSDAFIEAVENGKIGAAGLDVVENEFGLYYYDHKSDILKNRELALLRSFPNVIVSHHMAFYTRNYVETVVKDSMKSCKLYMEGKENPWEVR